MSPRISGILAACVALVFSAATPAWSHGEPVTSPEPGHVGAAARLMEQLRMESRRNAARIRALYAQEVPRLELADRRALRRGLATGTIAPLPTHLAALDVTPRLRGRSPIGEMDLANQDLYVAARPETIGCLLEVAARVTSGPVEVTSLVRHRRYQRALTRDNQNARTSVPTHAMGLAFDISILHTPLATAIEIRDVLRAMAAEGKLLFLAEEHQLVFHVVPTPSHRHSYAAVYHASTLAPPPLRAGPPVWPTPDPGVARQAVALVAGGGTLETRSTGNPVEYAALFGWLLTSGLGTPPGEDLLLAGTGALVSRGAMAWWPVVLLAIVAVVTSDTILFALGRAGRSMFRPRVPRTPAWVSRTLGPIMSRWSGAAVAVARFVPGSRAVVYGSAGARGMRPIRFLLIDICAAILWVPLVVTVGAWLLAGRG